MTGTIDDAFALSEPAPETRFARAPRRAAADPVVEQAKGALIFRYSVGSAAAFSIMELWAAEAAVGVEDVARAIVHDICLGDRHSRTDPQLVRWLEDRLRQEVSPVRLRSVTAAAAEPELADEPVVPVGPEEPPVVTVAVDHSDVSLDAVVEAVRRAARLGVPLRLTVDADVRGDGTELARAHVEQRMCLAAELARALEPGVEVRVPEEPSPSGG